MYVVIVSVLVLCAVYTQAGRSFAYERHFGTKTPYWAQQDWREWASPPEGCSAVHLQGLVRHGARNPGKGDIKLMGLVQKLIEDHAADIEASTNQWALKWTRRYKNEEAHLLTKIGQNEHFSLAKRLKAAFPDILGIPYSPLTHKFTSTQVNRAGMSAGSFTYGLYEGEGGVGECKYQPVDITTDTIATDHRLRFYTSCPKYASFHEDKTSITEMYQFQGGPLMSALRENVTAALGLSRPVTFKELHGMYRACSYDTVEDGSSRWCALLGREGVRIVDYHDDLKQWWKKTYGNTLNYQIACPLLTDMLHGMVSFLQGSADRPVVAALRFAHAETFMPLTSLLGLYRDPHPGLLANWSYDQIVGRQFRASHIAPYAANLLFVLYKCSIGEPLVRLTINEKETIIPGCQTLFCPFSTFKKLLENRTGPVCDFHGLCRLEQSINNPRSELKTKPTLWDALNLAAMALGFY